MFNLQYSFLFFSLSPVNPIAVAHGWYSKTFGRVQTATYMNACLMKMIPPSPLPPKKPKRIPWWVVSKTWFPNNTWFTVHRPCLISWNVAFLFSTFFMPCLNLRFHDLRRYQQISKPKRTIGVESYRVHNVWCTKLFFSSLLNMLFFPLVL